MLLDVWAQEGWLYLVIVMDLFSRKIVGWSMSSRMKTSLVCDALSMALCQRKPKPGLIVHSYRGSQYASHEYGQLLNKWQCVGSMSRKGNCWRERDILKKAVAIFSHPEK